MPERRVIVEEARRIPRFIEGIKWNPLSLRVNILSEPVMVGFISKGDLCSDPIDNDDASSQENNDPHYLLLISGPKHKYFD
jgi:hypothetical protein